MNQNRKPGGYLYSSTVPRICSWIKRPRLVGYSGLMDCVTHSLALTNHGLFEVGRYPAMSLSAQSRYWGWFLHRRLATIEEVTEWQENQNLTSNQYVEHVYQLFIAE